MNRIFRPDQERTILISSVVGLTEDLAEKETIIGAQAKATAAQTAAQTASIPRSLTAKATLVDADSLALLDSAASDAPKKGALSALWTYVKSKIKSDYTIQKTLTDGATITYNTTTGLNAAVTLGGDRTLSIPTNVTIGDSGRLVLIQDGTGGRALTLASGWSLTTANLASVAAMTASKKAVLSWTCIASGQFPATLIFIP